MSSLLYLLLCLSLHACSARHLGVIALETGREVYLIGKDVGKEKLRETSIALKLTPFDSQKLQTPEKHIHENEKPQTLESLACANTRKQKDSKVLGKEENNKGNKITVSSSQEVMKEATKKEGWKRQGRLTLGSVPHKAEETVNSKEDHIVEDVVVMDYAQPHRKPPIHNREP